MDTIGKVGITVGIIALIVIVVIIVAEININHKIETNRMLENQRQQLNTAANNELGQFYASVQTQKQKLDAERQALATELAIVNQHVVQFNTISSPTPESRDQITQERATYEAHRNDFNQHLEAARQLTNQTETKVLQDVKGYHQEFDRLGNIITGNESAKIPMVAGRNQ